MGKARLKTGERKDIFLYKTRVENLFINEFLPDSPGDCVKVFLFGLMYAQYEQQIDSRTMALTLGITEKDVDNAWKYWESKGLVRLTADSEGGIEEIEFIRQIDLFYGKTLEESYPVNGVEKAGEETAAAEEQTTEETGEAPDTEESAASIIERLINRQLRDMFRKYEMLTGRTLSTHEAGKLTDSIKIYNIEPDVLDFAIDYCIGIDKTSIDYICKVALRWTEEGARDVGAVKQMLDKRSKRNDAYRKVFAELGFSRLPNPADREIMDRWFDEMGCTLKDVLDACRAAGGVRDPNLRYVNKVLENKILEKGGINTRAEQVRKTAAEPSLQTGQPAAAQDSARVSRKVLRDYYDYIRDEGEKDRKARLTEVTNRIPEMRDIFSAETQINSLVITMKPGPDARDKRQRLKDRRQEIEEKKKELLTQNGYPEDYLERKYRCDICKDTGYTDEGRVCTCAKERAEEAYEWISRTGNR